MASRWGGDVGGSRFDSQKKKKRNDKKKENLKNNKVLPIKEKKEKKSVLIDIAFQQEHSF